MSADNSSNTNIKQVVQSLSEQRWYIGFLQPIGNESYSATIAQTLESKPNEKITAYYNSSNQTLAILGGCRMVSTPNEPLTFRVNK